MAEIINEAMETTTQNVNPKEFSKKDKFVTGFCITGAAVAFGHAAIAGGKKAANFFKEKFSKEKREEKKALKAEKKKAKEEK